MAWDEDGNLVAGTRLCHRTGGFRVAKFTRDLAVAACVSGGDGTKHLPHSPLERCRLHVQRQIGLLEAQEDIKSAVQEELGERQREMFLREQMKAIQKELGEGDENKEIEELREKLGKLELPREARQEVERELGRLERAGRESMEAQVIRTYLEWIAELPWNKRSDDNLDLNRAQTVLDEDHYGLPDVKDRVLEFLAVRQLRMQQEAASAEEGKAERKVEEVAQGESTDTPQATATR